jgi:enoyl-CoA hydratase/carnithine racemase
VSLDGAIAVVEIDRQANLNALDIATVTELEARLRELSADAKVRCGVLTAAGERAFIGGADLEYTGRVKRNSPAAVAAAREPCNRALQGGHPANLAAERERIAEVLVSEDAREGCAAFLERREPAFAVTGAPR